MSRRRLQAKDPTRYSVWVGWDAPMRTFFYQVWDAEETREEYLEGDMPTYQGGNTFDEYPDNPREVLEAVKPYAEFDWDEVTARLLLDKRDRVMS